MAIAITMVATSPRGSAVAIVVAMVVTKSWELRGVYSHCHGGHQPMGAWWWHNQRDGGHQPMGARWRL